VDTVERLWTDPTLQRTVDADPADVPLPAYAAFVDAPDVTAAAARHLGVARYTVRVLGDDWYAADDGDGARGVYRVLVRERGRRVILSWGRHTGRFLGTITGSALSVVDLQGLGNRTAERLHARVLIDNGPAAALARALFAVFGFIADRKLTHGFHVTARVATWALDHPREFCAWLENTGLEGRRVDAVRDAARCDVPASALTRPER
jgi:hypothetical protein